MVEDTSINVYSYRITVIKERALQRVNLIMSLLQDYLRGMQSPQTIDAKVPNGDGAIRKVTIRKSH